MKLIIRWFIIIASLFVAERILPGIHVSGKGWIVFSITAVILGILNAILKPVLKFFSCGLILITMGLFSLVINGVVLWLASLIAVNWFNVDFTIDTFLSAVLGALIVSVVSLILSKILTEKEK